MVFAESCNPSINLFTKKLCALLERRNEMSPSNNIQEHTQLRVGLMLAVAALLTAASLVATWADGPTSDSFQHVIVATQNGDVHEVFFNPSIGIHVTQPALANFAGIIGVAGYFTPNDGIQH